MFVRRVSVVGMIILGALAVMPFTGRATVLAKKADACALLKTAEISQALGAETSPGVSSATDSCLWSVGGEAADSVNVYFFKLDASSKRDATNGSKAASAKKIKGIKGTTVAFYDLTEKLARVIKGKNLLTVNIDTDADDTTTATAYKTLTKLAAKRL